MSDPDQSGNRDRDPEDERADFDRRFGEIVAGFEPDDHDDPPQPLDPGPQRRAAQDQAASWRAWADPEEEEHFVPAATDPLPAGDLHFWGIIVGLTLGPLLILLSAVFSVIDSTPWGVLGMLATVVGFVLLVLRSPRRRSGDDGSGARV
ncbi:MAG: hypothetical protein WA962_06515 [Ornithinimicrobium sp.]